MPIVVCAALAMALMVSAVLAAAHDDDEDASPSDSATGTAALRIDKLQQRRLGIRTQRADTPAPLLTWPARVIADPQRSARVMADQPGVLEAPAAGFPLAGTPVRAGQVLARLRPSYSDPERRDLEADWEAAKRAVALGRLQINRYSIDEAEDIEVRLLTPSIQILLDYRAAVAREAQLARALSGEVEIRAPVSGVVLSAAARAGRVVAAGETLFELNAVDAAVIEAQFSDARVDPAAVTQALDRHQALLSLSLSASSLDPASRTRRVLYRVAAPGDDEPVPALKVGEPLLLRVPHALPAGRYQLPVTAVFHQAGRDWVWLHIAAEQFIAQPVQVTPLDSQWLRVDAGLQADQRVVIDGAAALSAQRLRVRT